MAQELQKKNDLVTKTATNQPAESELKTSQNQEALVKQIAELKTRVVDYKKKDIFLHLDDEVQKALSEGLTNIDNHLQTDSANSMKTAQKMLGEVEKCQNKIPELIEIVDMKINSFLENLSNYLHGVVSENQSLRQTHFLLLQIITHTLERISDTMDGPI
ncbi:hypothetical protein L1887_39044 [Cichorium endivia]|nr:hypothetical protein L1887_39044 [Cichorium endivia]